MRTSYAYSHLHLSELIRELRSTFAFARMGQQAADTLSSDDGDKPKDEDEISTLTDTMLEDEKPLTSGTRRSVQLPYSASAWAVLQASFPLSDDEWNQMLAVLTAMKPALTTADE